VFIKCIFLTDNLFASLSCAILAAQCCHVFPVAAAAPPHHLPPFPAWRACTPVTRIQHGCSAAPCLSTPQRSTRGVAPRNNAARVAKATMDLFQKTNEM
jgi:hypothetical protein